VTRVERFDGTCHRLCHGCCVAAARGVDCDARRLWCLKASHCHEVEEALAVSRGVNHRDCAPFVIDGFHRMLCLFIVGGSVGDDMLLAMSVVMNIPFRRETTSCSNTRGKNEHEHTMAAPVNYKGNA
jgi:hypothetical protein